MKDKIAYVAFFASVAVCIVSISHCSYKQIEANAGGPVKMSICRDTVVRSPGEAFAKTLSLCKDSVVFKDKTP